MDNGPNIAVHPSPPLTSLLLLLYGQLCLVPGWLMHLCLPCCGLLLLVRWWRQLPLRRWGLPLPLSLLLLRVMLRLLLCLSGGGGSSRALPSLPRLGLEDL